MAYYLKAKHAANEHFKASGLTYVVLRPVTFTNNGRNTEVILGDKVGKFAQASRAFVAHVLDETATTGRYDGMKLNMQS